MNSFPEWIHWFFSRVNSLGHLKSRFTLSFFFVKITHGLTDLNRYNENWDLPCFFSLGTRDLGSQKERERYWDAGQTTGCVMGFGNIWAGKWDLNVLLIVHPLLTGFTEIVSCFFILCNFIATFFSAWPGHFARLALDISNWLCSVFHCYVFTLHVFIFYFKMFLGVKIEMLLFVVLKKTFNWRSHLLMLIQLRKRVI